MKKNSTELLNKVFDILDHQFHDRYVVMNKYDEMPESIPSDIDMNVSLNDFKRLDSVITLLSQKTKLIITQKIWHNYRKCAYILSPSKLDAPFRLQLDFFADFAVRNTPLLIPWKEMNNTQRRFGRFYVPSFEVEYVFLLLRRIYKNDFSLEHCSPIKAALSEMPEKIIEYSKSYFGEKLAVDISRMIMQDDIHGLKTIHPLLWKQMKRKSFRNSLGLYYLRYWADQLIRTIYRIRYPVGMSVALLSPDGGGKSTTFERLKYLCWGSFHGIEKRYFRPRVLKNPGHYNIFNPKEESETNTDPHAVVQDSFLKSLVRFSFYNIDFIAGYWLKIKIMEIKKKLIIFDRYYYDYYVDMKRYKFKLPKWLPHLFGSLIPSPNLIFILDGDPKVLFARKKELPLEEITRQVAEYRNVASKMNNAILIDTERSIEIVSEDITTKILMYKAQRTARAMRNRLDSNGIPL